MTSVQCVHCIIIWNKVCTCNILRSSGSAGWAGLRQWWWLRYKRFDYARKVDEFGLDVGREVVAAAKPAFPAVGVRVEDGRAASRLQSQLGAIAVLNPDLP